MKVEEFYSLRFELLEMDLMEYWPKSDRDGKQYITCPMEPLEDFKERIELDLQEFCYDDDELEENLTKEEEDALFNSLFEKFTELYESVVKKREEFKAKYPDEF